MTQVAEHPASQRPGGPRCAGLACRTGLGQKRAGLAAKAALSRLLAALRAGDEAEDHACFYMADFADRRLWESFGHPNLRHFARHGADRGYSTLKGYVAVGRALRELPALQAAFEAGRTGFTQVKHLVRVVTPETEEAWLAWAIGRSCAEVQAMVERRRKGDLPSDPERRRIHEVKHRIVLDLSAADYLVWERHRAKTEAELGVSLTNLELVLLGAREGLCSEVDGARPGRRRVLAEHYRIEARPAGGSDPDELVAVDEDGEPVRIRRTELTRPLPAVPEPVGAVRVAAAWGDTSGLDPRNNGPFAAEEERDAPASAALREEVLARDGFRCLSCGQRQNLAAHHVHWRRYGGRTVAKNLATTCEACHSLIHARGLIVLGDVEGGLRFLGPDGREFGARAGAGEGGARAVVAGAGPAGSAPQPEGTAGEPEGTAGEPEGTAGEPEGAEPGEEAQARGEGAAVRQVAAVVELRTLPPEVDADWWGRHVDLFAWNERVGVLELTPGFACESAGRRAREAAPPARLRLGDLVGQRRTRERLGVAIAAARQRGEPLGHLLFSGGPGLGKTSLAEAVAGELGTSAVRLPAPLVKAPDMLLRALTSLEAGQVLFMDELQALPLRAGEVLYEALDGGVLSLPVRQGLLQRTLRVRLPEFTFVGATTDEELLAAPLRSRLRRERLGFYAQEELAEVVTRGAAARGLTLTPDGAARLAQASRGTPREGLRLLGGVRDEATLAGVDRADGEVVERALRRGEIDARGLDPLDRAYLAALARAGGPVGLRTLAAVLGAGAEELRTVREPWLQRLGLIVVTPRGRTLRRRDDPRLGLDKALALAAADEDAETIRKLSPSCSPACA